MKQNEQAINRRKIKAYLSANDLTQDNLASMMDISHTSMSHKLNGKKGFTEREIAFLISIIGIDIFFK